MRSKFLQMFVPLAFSGLLAIGLGAATAASRARNGTGSEPVHAVGGAMLRSCSFAGECLMNGDASQLLDDNFDGCNGQTWELRFQAGFDIYDEGPVSIGGGCYGDYWDCNCNYIRPSPAAPSRPSLQIVQEYCYDGGYYPTTCNTSAEYVDYQYYWSITAYQTPNYQSCGDCNVSGNQGTQTISTVTYSAGWDIAECEQSIW